MQCPTYAIINHNSVSQCLSSIKNVSGELCNDNKDWRERERVAGRAELDTGKSWR